MAKRPSGAGSLDELVAFDDRADVSDGYGNRQEAFVEQFQTRASFTFLRGSETVIAARLEGRQPILVGLRDCADVRRIRPDWRMRDVRRGVPYSIRSIAPRAGGGYYDLLVETNVAA